MVRLLKWIKKLCLTYAVICSTGNNNNMIQRKELGNIRMDKVNLYFNVFKTRSVDVFNIIYFNLYIKFSQMDSLAYLAYYHRNF